MMIKRTNLIILLLAILSSCGGKVTPDEPAAEDPDRAIARYDYPDVSWDEGEKYIWDYSYVPEITVNVTLEDWNALLTDYDRSSATEMYIPCDVEFKRGSETTVINKAGFRLKGNTSRRRPEGNSGDMHKSGATWRQFHCGINFKKFVDDDSQQLKGVTRLHLKFFNGDPAYVRELFSYDLFRRDGIWTAFQDNYCRLWVYVEGDAKPVYIGVYNLIENADKQYLKRRSEQFGSTKGNLWKCVLGASLDLNTITNMGPDTAETDYLYELKESKGTYEEAAAQLKDFIKNVNNLGNADFYDWIRAHCDVDLLLRTYAVNVVLGNWDDYWVNANNFYMYFNSNDPTEYKFFFIPYDYDHCLGNSSNKGYLTDAVRQNPLYWGDKGVLMNRLMKFDECKEVYRKELKRLVDPANALTDYTSATERIKNWQQSVSSYVKGDAGGNSSIKDTPGGNHTEYRLLDPSSDVNVFKIKYAIISGLE